LKQVSISIRVNDKQDTSCASKGRRRVQEFLVVAFAMFAVSALRAEPQSEGSGIPASVVWVATGGSWQASNERGHYRVVVENMGWEHVASRVYIEWVAEYPEKQRTTVLAAAMISELGTKWSVGLPKITPSKNGTSLELSAVHAYEPQKRKFVLELGTPGHYRIKP
jgi:hypothetical protein